MTDATLDTRALRLLAGLADPAGRRDAARALAAHLGADDLIVFVRDSEVGALLAALGFRQTLPGGRAWRDFLAACTSQRHHTADMPWPEAGTTTRALGLAVDDGGVLVLLGGAPYSAEAEALRLLLPMVAATFQDERTALTAVAQATVARQAAAQARELAERLDAAHRELQQELRTREDFLSSASHDLKNPLTSIRGSAQLLRRHVERSDDLDRARLTRGLSQIETVTAQMAAQIDEMLEVTRFRMGRPLDLQLCPTDLVALARRVAGQHQQATEQHEVRVEADEASLSGRWDAPRLERVVGNLLNNAIKYSPEGGTIVVTVVHEHDDAGEWAVLAVRDQGIGIPEDDLPRLFERFQRGHNVVGRIAGTGIGLAAAKQIVEQHGGSIVVESTLGRGSTFTVRLPIAAGGAEPARTQEVVQQ